VGVLFSGGLDSIVLARLADLYVPMDEYVKASTSLSLLSFDNPDSN
jgi:asparagine synthetase B (glutamine-hydrolysing)